MTNLATPWWENFFASPNEILWERLETDGWEEHVRPWVENAGADDPDLPVILPRLGTDGMCWYAGARSSLGNLRLQEELQAFIGPSHSDYDRLPMELDCADPIESAFAEGASPLGKVSTPEDIADSIMSVITGTDLMTGQIIAVDGGFTIN